MGTTCRKPELAHLDGFLAVDKLTSGLAGHVSFTTGSGVKHQRWTTLTRPTSILECPRPQRSATEANTKTRAMYIYTDTESSALGTTRHDADLQWEVTDIHCSHAAERFAPKRPDSFQRSQFSLCLSSPRKHCSHRSNLSPLHSVLHCAFRR